MGFYFMLASTIIYLALNLTGVIIINPEIYPASALFIVTITTIIFALTTCINTLIEESNERHKYNSELFNIPIQRNTKSARITR